MPLFTSLYELFIGPNPDFPEYREGIFSAVGLMTLVMTLGLCALFYAAVGRWKPVFHKPLHWLLVLLVAALLGFVFAYTQSQSTLAATDGYTVRFALFNALYAAVYFFLFSLLLKRTSIFAKHTPFKF